MVEALSTSFQNLYNKYTRSESAENARRADPREVYIRPKNTVVVDDDAAADPSLNQRYRPKQPRKTFVFNVKSLCQAKDTAWHVIREKRIRPVVGLTCPVCVPVRYMKRNLSAAPCARRVRDRRLVPARAGAA